MENDKNPIEVYRNSFKNRNLEEYYNDIQNIKEEYDNVLMHIFNISNVSELSFDIIKNTKLKIRGLSFEDVFNHFCILDGEFSQYINFNDMEFCFTHSLGFSHLIHENGIITNLSRTYVNHSDKKILSWLYVRNESEKQLFENFYKEGKIY
jgi:hypothetical protein